MGFSSPRAGAGSELSEPRREFPEQHCEALFCFGFTRWKQPYVRPFLKMPERRIHFVRSKQQALRAGIAPGSGVVVWSRREQPGVVELCRQLGIPLWRMEDGFLRSVGLGSDFVRPASLVLDGRGIYYDSRTPSDLECILSNVQLSANERVRASRLRELIVTAGLSKYNAGSGILPREVPARVAGRLSILVPGQVEDDASVLAGSPEVRSNLDLVRRVREERPDAFLIYKPHPDVLSGNRPGNPVGEIARFCDRVIRDAPITGCIEAVDEVHTMTSLTGFEALLRGRTVVTYGQPFYAGWGLTDDRLPVKRRQRRLELEELIFGVLISYPRYYSAAKNDFATAEEICAELTLARATGGGPPPSRRGFRRQAYRVWVTLKGAIGAR